MKIYAWIGWAAVVLALNGCGTVNNRIASQESVPKGVNPQTPAFSGLGEVSQTEKGIQVTLSGDSLFKVGSSHLSPEGLQKADAIAVALMKYPGDLVSILEYTDNSGSPTRNLKLSQRRADHLKVELVKQGVPGDNVTAIGKGYANPVAGNDTPEDRAKNRRVVIDITTS